MPPASIHMEIHEKLGSFRHSNLWHHSKPLIADTLDSYSSSRPITPTTKYWSIGVLEYWSIGVLEYWSTGVLVHSVLPITPTLQHSNTSILQYSNTPILHSLSLHHSSAPFFMFPSLSSGTSARLHPLIRRGAFWGPRWQSWFGFPHPGRPSYWRWRRCWPVHG